ncbi:MAG: hypothetical protein JNL28_00195 [Planctomycetes bacterium]|nr:hypothetical protein [Planctomycetota bacterium]
MIGHLRTLSLACATLLAAGSARAQLVPPPNDLCINAIQIGDGTISGTTIGSTNTANGCGLSGLTSDVWYSYTATRSGLLSLDTCGSNFDTSITLYAFCGALFQIVCNDDAPPGSPCGFNAGFDSYLTYPVRANETIKIRISGFVGAQGTFVLTARNATGQPFCLGDSTSATVCPCANSVPPGTIGGCTNSGGQGGKLEASGLAEVAGDSARLTVTGLPPGAPILFFQGNTKQAGGYGQSFGDGIRCVTGTIVRLSTKFSSNGTVSIPQSGDPSLHAAGGVPTSGGIVLYQGWYRNGANFCLPSTFNLTNGVEVSWAP